MALRRSRHSLSHYRLFTGDMGQLIPVSLLEVLPGDTYRMSSSLLLRVTPLVRPVMHPVHIRIHSWFVPHRIVWSDFETFMSGDEDDVSYPSLPTVDGSGGSSGGLLDHLGVPPGCVNTTINALPVRSYNLIWNEFYRDQDLDTAVGEDDLNLLRVSWQKDYFTTARLTPQQGSSVEVSFSAGEIPVKGIGVPTTQTFPNTNQSVHQTRAENATYAKGAGPGGVGVYEEDPLNTGYPYIRADLSEATASMSIESWREAMALQRFREARSRFGSRYVDYLRYLGVRPSDGRLSRPEYLGGGKQTVAFSEVLNTNGDGAGATALGDLGGHGIAAIRTRPWRRFFEEHGYILTMAYVRPRTIYSDQIHRLWVARDDRDNWWQKEGEIQGQQSISEQEVYAPGSLATVFGYVDRYLEYRQHPSGIAGIFRDATADDWHYARIFGSAPTLNSSFVSCVPTDRVYADTGEPEIYCMSSHNVSARRLVSKIGRI